MQDETGDNDTITAAVTFVVIDTPKVSRSIYKTGSKSAAIKIFFKKGDFSFFFKKSFTPIFILIIPVIFKSHITIKLKRKRRAIISKTSTFSLRLVVKNMVVPYITDFRMAQR
jgi:hypothetical protein